MIDGLKSKIVIVTGGAHGIGKAYCLGFAKAGAHVVIADIDETAAKRGGAEITNDFGAPTLALHTDVSNEASTKEMATRVLDRFGRIDVLVNNAAVFSVVPMNRGTIENVNCLAPGNTLSEENPTEQMIKFRESSVGLRALKRIQMPNDVVGAMLFLASPLSDFITGQTINVDGGISFR